VSQNEIQIASAILFLSLSGCIDIKLVLGAVLGITIE